MKTPPALMRGQSRGELDPAYVYTRRGRMDSSDPKSMARLRFERDLYRGMLLLGSASDVRKLVSEALQLMVRLCGAEQGYLELFDSTTRPEDAPKWWTAAACSDVEVEEIRAMVSRGVIAEAVARGEVISSSSALLDPRFRDRASVQRCKIHAVLCVPICGEARALGVVYLQRRTQAGDFTEEDRECAALFARHMPPIVESVFAREALLDSSDPTREYRQRMRLDMLVGRSSALAHMIRELAVVAAVDVCVLLTGETGTGKNCVARAIHDNSARSAGPLVEVNCAALPETLIESELFGAIAGAHSNANRRLEGKVSAASGGTLLLDEIAELPLTAQAKLLQLLQSKTYYALGAARPEQANVRIVAATNVDLAAATAEKRFREDLYHRIQVFPIRVPTLAERREDIPELAKHFCATAQKTHGLPPIDLSIGAVQAICAAEWPGNVRELANAVEAAAIRAAGQGLRKVEPSHVFPDFNQSPTSAPKTLQSATRNFQRELVARVLDAHDWNVTAAAKQLDITRAHAYNLIKLFGLKRK